MRRTSHRSLVLAAVLAALFARPARAEVQGSSETGFTTTATVTVPADRYAVWAALIAPAKWWNPAHTWSGRAENLYIDSQATGCFCELLPADPAAPEGTRRGSVEHLHIVRAQPGVVLRMTGGLGPLHDNPARGVFTVALAPLGTGAEAGTQVTITYAVAGLVGLNGTALAPAVDQVVTEQLGRLAGLFAPPPAPEPDQPKG